MSALESPKTAWQQTWVQRLGITPEAAELHADSDVVDLHVDSFIWSRLLAYDPRLRHESGPFEARYALQADLPRLRAGGVSGAAWIITTQPFRSAKGRVRALASNLTALRELLESQAAQTRLVTSEGAYRAARAADLHAAFFGIQGGSCLEAQGALSGVDLSQVLFVTLVHLTSSALGTTSSPWARRDQGLRDRGREVLRALENMGIWPDLAHASRQTFWDVVRHHDPTRPLLVTHTGCSQLHPHWRNLDDAQLDAIAASGGMVGILYHGPYLGGPPWGGTVAQVAQHIRHAVRRIGAAHVCLGSDWDGLIATPVDMPTASELPRLTQAMLDVGLSAAEIRGVLGDSFLAFLRRQRG